MSTLNCPKCPGRLIRLELVGVEIDRCEGCHGIFLDRGELEALLQAEHRYSRGRNTETPYTGRRRSDDAPPTATGHASDTHSTQVGSHHGATPGSNDDFFGGIFSGGSEQGADDDIFDGLVSGGTERDKDDGYGDFLDEIFS